MAPHIGHDGRERGRDPQQVSLRHFWTWLRIRYEEWNMPNVFGIGRLAEYALVRRLLGYHPRRRGEWLRQQITRNGWLSGAELGVAEGRTFFHLLNTCPRLRMIGVDSFTSQYTGEEYSRWRDIVMRQASRYGCRARIIVADTTLAADLVADGSLDFVFIDADHSYEGVSGDIATWAPKVKQGGMISGHDIAAPPVRRAVEKMCSGYNVWKPDGVWYMMKGMAGD